MNYYFMIICFLYVLSLGLHLGKHGQPREDKYNFWVSLFALALNLFLVVNAIKVGF